MTQAHAPWQASDKTMMAHLESIRDRAEKVAGSGKLPAGSRESATHTAQVVAWAVKRLREHGIGQ